MSTTAYYKKLDKSEFDSVINILNKGGIIIYPTETIWAIGCKSTIKKSILKVYELKKRSYNMPFINLLDCSNNLSKYINHINLKAIDLNQEPNSPPTIIYPNCKKEYSFLSNEFNEISFRVTPVPELKKIIKSINSPLISSSANISGDSFPKTIDNISSSILNSVDVIINFDVKSSGKPSSVIKINKDQIEYLRK